MGVGPRCARCVFVYIALYVCTSLTFPAADLGDYNSLEHGEDYLSHIHLMPRLVSHSVLCAGDCCTI